MEKSVTTIPDAYAIIEGSEEYPQICGEVCFYEVHGGTIVAAKINGLPENESGDFFGFHIHEGNSCSGDLDDPFKNVGSHYNPGKMEHPKHAGDLPVLLGNNGMAWCEFYTNRFYPEDIIGKTIIIHDMADDFRSQPSGDSGNKIACGEIKSCSEME